MIAGAPRRVRRRDDFAGMADRDDLPVETIAAGAGLVDEVQLAAPAAESHEIVVLDGVTTTVKVAHMRLCHGRMLFVRAYPRDGAPINEALVRDLLNGGFLDQQRNCVLVGGTESTHNAHLSILLKVEG